MILHNCKICILINMNELSAKLRESHTHCKIKKRKILPHALTSSVSQEDFAGIPNVAVSVGEKVGDLVSYYFDTLGLTV